MEQPKQQIKNLNKGNRRPKGRRSAPKTENRLTGKKEPYAFIFKDPSLGELPILNSSRGWWVDPVKVQKLVDAYKFYATDDQACYYAGITATQLMDFQKLHPEFYRIKHLAKQDPALRAKKTVFAKVDKDVETARWLLTRLEKETFSPRVENTGPDGRDLFDGMTEEYKKLINEIRDAKRAENKNKEHAGKQPAGDVDTGQGGDRDETASTQPEPSG